MTTAVAREVTVQMLEEFGDAWNRHDVDAIMRFMADDCAFETTAGPEPCGKRYEGRDRVRAPHSRCHESISKDVSPEKPRHRSCGPDVGVRGQDSSA